MAATLNSSSRRDRLPLPYLTRSQYLTSSRYRIPGTAASVYVAVDITHAYIGDLKVDLIAPDGATRTLHNREGGSAGDLDRMYTLSFDDLSITGTWKLQIHDGFNVYQGVLNSWTLTVNYGDPPTIPVTGISGSGDVYYVTVSALQNGAYNLDLVSSGHNIADAASNSLTNTSPAGADETYTVSTTVADNTNPRLESIERYSPVTQNTDSQTLVYEVTFSEDVTGVDTGDFVLSSGSTGSTTTADPVTSISGSGSVYYATVSASTDGTYNLDLVSSGHDIEDTAENPLTNTVPTTGTDETYTVSTVPADSTAPTISSIQRYNPAVENTDSQTLIYEVTFSENVTGVDASDFALSSGSTGGTGGGSSPVTDVSGSGSVYYATVSASTDGTYNLDLVSSGHDIADAASNSLTNTTPTTGTDQTYTVSITIIDNTAPTISSIQRYNPAVENTDSQTLIYEVTFSENVTGVDASDFALSSGSTGGGNIGSGQSVQTRSPALAISYNQTVTDTISVAASGTAASISVAVDITHQYIVDLKIDLIAPDGTVQTLHNRESDTADIDQTYQPDFGSASIAGDWILRIHDNFSADDGVLNSWTLTIDYGATPSPVTEVSGSGSTYYATVSASTDGTYNLDLVSSGHDIEDAAENPLTNTVPTTGTDQTYTVSTTVIDNTAPTLASIHRSSPAAENTDSQTLVYEVTFSEDVAGVDVSDFALSSGSTGRTGGGSSPVTGVSGSGDVYSVTVSALQDGTYNLDLVSSGHDIADAASNSLTNTTPTTGTDQTYTVSITIIDNTAPTISSIQRYNPAVENTDSQTLIYEVTFSENVTGVDASDFALSSGSTGGGGGGGNTGSGQSVQTRSPALAISYNQTVTDTISVAASGTAASISVAVDITHQYIVDLKIDLIAPDGTVQTLHNRESGTADIDQTYQPDFGSASIAGDWILRIHDNFSADDGVLNSWTLTIDYGATPSPVTEVSGSGSTYYATVSASTDGTYNLDLVSSGHDIEDAAENPLTNTVPTTGTDQTYTVSTTVIDNTAPTLASIHRSSPAAENTDSQTLVYEVTFSEDVAGVDVSDFALSSGSTGRTGGGSSPVTGVSGSGDVYSVTVSALQDGTYNLDLVSSGHDIADAASNSLTNTTPTTGTDQTYTVSITIIDNTAPTISSIQRYNPAVENTDSQTLIYEVTFSENVTGVDASDFALSSGSTGGGGGGGNTGSGQSVQTRSPALAISYNQTVTDTISVAASGTAASISVAVDITHQYIVDLKIDLIAPDGTVQTLHNRESDTADIDQTYQPDFGSASIAGDWILRIHDNFSADDGVLNSWTLTIDYGATPSPVTEVSGSGSTYYATVSASTDGTYNLDLVSSGHDIEDAAENPLTNTVPTTGTDQTYTVSTTVIDNTAPTLASIHRSSPAAENTDSQTLVYEVTFSEDVAGVDVSDFALSSGSTGRTGGGSSPVTGVSGSGDVYSVTVSALQDGTYNLDLVSSGHDIADAASNSLTNTTPTTGTDQTYTVSITIIDNTAPTISSIQRYNPAVENTDSQTLIYEVTFSENVTGVDASDFALSSGSTGGGGGGGNTGSGQSVQTRSPALAISYNQTVTDTISVAASGTAASISVAVDITHQYIVDLKIDLIAPDGTVQTLHNRESDTADIDQTYQPDFGSASIAGDWILRIHDNFSADDGVLNSWTLTIDYGATPSPVTEVSGSGSTYYATVSASTDGTYNLDLVSSGHDIEDAAENPLTNTVPTTGTDQTYTVSTTVIDNTAPTLASIHRSSPAAENTDSQTLVYEVTFSEDVAGVDVSDFALSSGSTGRTGGGSSPVTGVSGSGDVYSVTVSALQDGTYNLDLVSSGHDIADAASNSLTNTTPTTGTDQTYTVSITIIDNTAPTISSIQRYNPAVENTDSQT